MIMRISQSKFMAGCSVRSNGSIYRCMSLNWQRSRIAAMKPSSSRGTKSAFLPASCFRAASKSAATGGLDQAIRTTRELVANREVPAIFEGVFEHDGVLVRVDVLHRRRDGRWRLVEVKSSTSVKEQHLDDVAIQYRVLSRSGLDVGSCCLAHVNRSFVFRGGSIDPWRFFRIRNVTRQVVRLQPKLTFQLRAAFTVLSMPKAPDIAPGKHCTSPVTCEFFDRCNPPLPDDHIGYLPRLHASAEEELEELGVESIHDIPDDFELTEIQRRACYMRADGGAVVQPRTQGCAGKSEVPALLHGL